jgi:hypothetical protein
MRHDVVIKVSSKLVEGENEVLIRGEKKRKNIKFIANLEEITGNFF